MWRLWLILSTLVFSCLYQFFPNTEAIGGVYELPANGWGFPFSDMKLSPENYVFAFFEHFNPFVISVILFSVWKKYRVAMVTYVCIEFTDLVDHVLTYSEPWFNGPPTFNHLKVLFFGASIIYEKYGR